MNYAGFVVYFNPVISRMHHAKENIYRGGIHEGIDFHAQDATRPDSVASRWSWRIVPWMKQQGLEVKQCSSSTHFLKWRTKSHTDLTRWGHMHCNWYWYIFHIYIYIYIYISSYLWIWVLLFFVLQTYIYIPIYTCRKHRQVQVDNDSPPFWKCFNHLRWHMSCWGTFASVAGFGQNIPCHQVAVLPEFC